MTKEPDYEARVTALEEIIKDAQAKLAMRG
jgi:hypothetical protein